MNHVDFGALQVNVTPAAQRPPRPRLSQGALRFTRRVPARTARDCWYFIEDNLIADGEVSLQWFADHHGEARCSSPTSRLLNASDAARTELIHHYSDAQAIAPQPVMVDVRKWAPPDMAQRRTSIDPVAALREGVDLLLAEMVSCKKTDAETRAQFAARYGRLRDRMAHMRESFVHIEAAFELMQDKLVDFLEDGE